MATLVTLEGLPHSAREDVLKCLAARGHACLPPTEFSDPGAASGPTGAFSDSGAFSALFHRTKALARALADGNRTLVIGLGGWLEARGLHPVLQDLHADLAARLAQTLRVRRHVLVFVHTDPHEAFEALIGAGAREVTLRDVIRQSIRLDSSSPGRRPSPFEWSVREVHAEKFAGDCGAAVSELADAVLAGLADT